MRKIIAAIIITAAYSRILTAAVPDSINKFTLGNGITVIHKESAVNRIIAVKLFTRKGSVLEPESKTGVCLLMQGLLMKGTKQKSQKEISSLIEGMGGSMSFGGTFDYLEGSLVIPKKYVKKAFELFAEVIKEPVFDEEYIAKQKESSINSLKSRKDSIFTTADDAFRKKLYGGHPYSRIETGSEETINSITRDELFEYHGYYYTPENLVFSVVGDIRASTVRKLISRHFGGMAEIGAGYLNKEVADPVEAKGLIELKEDFNQAYLMMGYLAPEVNSGDYAPLKAAANVLGGRMSSRLFNELREKRALAYEVSCFYPSRRQKSRFVVYMGLDEKNIGAAQEGMQKIIEKIKNKPVGAEELEEVKRYVRGTYIMSHQTNASQAWYLGWWEILSKGCEYDLQYVEDISQVSSEDVQRAAKKYFIDNKVILKLYPK